MNETWDFYATNVSVIEKVQLFVLDDYEIQNRFSILLQSNAEEKVDVNHNSMGSKNRSFECFTCGKRTGCQGHMGHIELNYPLFNPITLKKLESLLENIEKAKLKRKVEVKVDQESFMYLEIGDIKLLPREVRDILIEENENPDLYIIERVPVISTIFRTEQKMGGEREGLENWSNEYNLIIEYHENIVDESIDDENYKHLSETVYKMINGGQSNVYGRNFVDNSLLGKIGSSSSSQTQGESSKKKLIKNNMISRTSEHVERGVARCNPTLKINEIGVSVKIEEFATIWDVVTEFNIKDIQKMFELRTLKIIRRNQNHFIQKTLSKAVEIEIGDNVLRCIEDGDLAAFNRTPSLEPHYMSGVFIKIINENSDAIDVNEKTFNMVNGDFDGDEFTIWYPKNNDARYEHYSFNNIKNKIFRLQDSDVEIKMKEEELISLFKLSTNKVHISELDHLFKLLPNPEKTKKEIMKYANPDTKGFLTGLNIIDFFIPEYINVSFKTEFYIKGVERYYSYPEFTKKIIIKNGKIISGIFDKSFNKVIKEIALIDENKAIYVIEMLEWIGLEYITYNNVTIDAGLLFQHNEKEVEEITNKCFEKLHLIDKEYIKNKLEQPISITKEELYEKKKQEILDELKFGYILYKDKDPLVDHVYMLMHIGAKGKEQHMLTTRCEIGESVPINNYEPDFMFSNRRSSVYYRTYEVSSESKGFIKSSYMVGLTLVEFLMQSIVARVGMALKSVGTAEPGEIGSKMVHLMQRYKIDNNNFVSSKLDQIFILEFLYSYTGFIETKIQSVEINFKFEKHSYLKKCIHSYKEFYNIDHYDIFNKKFDIFLEESSLHNFVIPINLFKSVLSKESDEKPDKKELEICIELIYNFFRHTERIYHSQNIGYNCDEFGITFGEFAKIGGDILLTQMHEYIFDALLVVKLHIMDWLSDSRINYYSKNIKQLKEIFAKILDKLHNSLNPYGEGVGIISGKCIHEKFLQDSLDSIHLSASQKGTIQQKKTLDRINGELIGFRSHLAKTNKEEKPFMYIQFKDNVSLEKCEDISENLMQIKIGDLVCSFELMFDKIKTVHARFSDDNAFIEDTIDHIEQSYNHDTYYICYRIVINKIMLISKKISTYFIAKTLMYYINSGALPKDTILAYSPLSDKGDEVIIRLYFNSDNFELPEQIITQTNDLTVCGVKGIRFVNFIPQKKIVQVSGINIMGIMRLRNMFPEIDYGNIILDNSNLLIHYYGEFLARIFMRNEIGNIVNISPTHISMYVDDAVSRKNEIYKSDYSKDIFEQTNKSPRKELISGAIQEMVAFPDDAESSLIAGGLPEYGTNYNRLVVDPNKIKHHYKNLMN